MILYSQRDPRWANKELGWGPPGATIGEYGCLETDFAIIAANAGYPHDPGQLDDALIADQVFIPCGGGDVDHDCLPDNALDVVSGGMFETTHVIGFDHAAIAAAVPSPDTWAILWISTAQVPTHFVIAASPDGSSIIDPWTGRFGSLAGYGGQAAVHKTILVKHLPVPPPAPPAPSPTPLPTPTPPPVPHYLVEDSSDVVVVPPTGDLEAVKAQADVLAKASPGSSFTVEDDTGKEVYTARVEPAPPPAPSPSPAPPPPSPSPTPEPNPTPAPAPPPPVIHPDPWGQLAGEVQDAVVAILRALGLIRD